MLVKKWLKDVTARLESAGIGTARLDALILLEDATGNDRAWLLAHPEFVIEKVAELDAKIKRRAEHEPLAYIRGFTEFYGRRFAVDARVLEPRPESETMIEQLMSLPLKDGMKLADVGTGSGALGITAKLVRPGLEVTLIDIDKKCLDVARQNAKKHNVNVELLQSDLLANFTLTPSPSALVLLANLPYVPDDYGINQAALAEPKLAIFGGPDGLDLYRKMFDQIDTKASKPSYILTECLPFQQNDLAQIATDHGYTNVTTEDFIQVFSNI